MPESVLFESEQTQTRAEVATYLRTVADRLDAGGPITLRSGSDSQTLEPPEHVAFELKAEREGPQTGPGELSIEFELEWDEKSDESGSKTGTLEIE